MPIVNCECCGEGKEVNIKYYNYNMKRGIPFYCNSSCASKKKNEDRFGKYYN